MLRVDRLDEDSDGEHFRCHVCVVAVVEEWEAEEGRGLEAMAGNEVSLSSNIARLCGGIFDF